MAKLDSLIPDGEPMVWISPKSKAAVTEGHVIWDNISPVFGRLFGGDQGVVPLSDIRDIDVEECTNTINLHCDGIVHCMDLTDGRAEDMARAIGRPARIWRNCDSAAAKRARHWDAVAEAIGVALPWLVTLLVVLRVGRIEGVSSVVVVLGLIVVGLCSRFLSYVARATLPHFLVGRSLTGEERRDFICVLTGLRRWKGLIPDEAEDQRLSHNRLRDWAMRKAYDKIPECGAWEPEIIEPGDLDKLRD